MLTHFDHFEHFTHFDENQSYLSQETSPEVLLRFSKEVSRDFFGVSPEIILKLLKFED
jgi:hypothetical protein